METQPSAAPIERSDSSSASSVDHHDDHPNIIHAPIPTRPQLPSRKSSGTLIIPRDSVEVEMRIDPDDVRAMSPRRTSEDLQVIGLEARNELQKSVHYHLSRDEVMLIDVDMPSSCKIHSLASFIESKRYGKNTTSWTATTSSSRNILEI